MNSWTQQNLKGPRGVNMAREEVTLAEAMRAAGYRTGLFGKWHLGAHREHGPTKQGFDEFFGIRNGFIDNHNHFYLHRQGFHDLYEGTREVHARGKYFPEMMIERSLKFIDENKSRPFFLYVGFNIPHYPEQPLADEVPRYRDLKQPRRSYAAMISTTDTLIGRVLARIDALKLREETIVIFVSDNGHSAESYKIRVEKHSSGYPKGHNYGANGGGGNTGKWIGHKGTFLEGGVRTPAIISYPASLPHGVVRHQTITIMDWYPTLLKLCGAGPANTKLDGHSLLPVIRSADAPSPHSVLHFQWQRKWAVRQGEWKLIGRDPNKPGAVARVTLHNLGDKKPEAVNHAKSKPKIVARLRDLHEAWAKDVFARQ